MNMRAHLTAICLIVSGAIIAMIASLGLGYWPASLCVVLIVVGLVLTACGVYINEREMKRDTQRIQELHDRARKFLKDMRDREDG